MIDLSKIGNRERLKAKPGDEPHWQRLRQGAFIGFRPSSRGGPGTWFARVFDADTRKYQRRALGDFGSLKGHDVFATARREAEAFADTVEAGGVAQMKIETVADACREYMKARPEAAGRFERWVFTDPLGRVRLEKLRRHHIEEWRKRLEAAPALVSRAKEGERKTRPRAPSTVNRDMVPVRAALSKVLAPGKPGSPAAWQEALTATRGADRQRTLYLDRAQRRALLAAIDEEAAPFVRALCLLPLRPGAMAALDAGDFDPRTRELRIRSDKAGGGRRITLPKEAAALFAAQAKDKLPAAPLFRRSGGQRWNKENWNYPIRAAAIAAGCDPATTTYTLRHSTITDLVNGGLPILTVAQVAGTSADMIEKHYGHLNRALAEEALAALAL